jgi:mannose-6-phosphate isomerase-like protein (cupin superfamily)
MRLLSVGDDPKGWIAGPWESELSVGIGWSVQASKESHRHTNVTEVYLVAAGSAVAVVGGEELPITTGDVLIIEPQEVRSFRSSSPDFRSFVLHIGGDGTPDKIVE